MFKTIKNAWSIPDVRRKILFTLLIIVVFRIGSAVPVPFLNVEALKALMDTVAGSGSALGYLDMLTGGAFANATLFAMGITPYINSSIIMQLLTVAIPPLERLAKEGEEGRKKISTLTRYLTVVLGLIQGVAYFFFLRNSRPNNMSITMFNEGFAGIFTAIVIIMSFTAGTALMMWLGEQINQNGIGNGISILLFAGIVARFPYIIGSLGGYLGLAANGATQYYFFVPLFVVMFLAVIWVVVFMNNAERRIPIQYAKRVVGRKMYGGQSTHMPIKVGMSGVMPIIFASSILSIPQTIKIFAFPNDATISPGWKSFFDAFSTTGWMYALVYFLLIIMFAFFYLQIQYNPVELANNLRQNNGTIPGIRPGKPTSDFISRILSKITLIGSLFLALVALLPIGFGALTGMQNMALGGTSIIIVVGVALDTVKQIESQMMMRHYKGFLD